MNSRGLDIPTGSRKGYLKYKEKTCELFTARFLYFNQHYNFK